jgi:hypothetical protein
VGRFTILRDQLLRPESVRCLCFSVRDSNQSPTSHSPGILVAARCLCRWSRCASVISGRTTQVAANGSPNGAANGWESRFPRTRDMTAVLGWASRISRWLFVDPGVFPADDVQRLTEKDKQNCTVCSTILYDGTSPHAHTILADWRKYDSPCGSFRMCRRMVVGLQIHAS